MIPRLDIHFPMKYVGRFLFGSCNDPMPESFFYLNHSRSAIVLALDALCLPKHSKVGVMVYNCHTVMSAITQAGCNPIFLDVDERFQLDRNDLRRKADGMSVLIVTHLFGILNDVKAIKKEYPDLIVIEDCAHAFGIDKLFGDFASFSVGQGKFPSIGDGGILCVNNIKFLAIVQQLYNSLPKYGVIQNAVLLSNLIVKSVLYSPCIYGCLTKPLIKDRRRSIAVKVSSPVLKMSRGIYNILLSWLPGKDKQIFKRLHNAETIKNSIVDDTHNVSAFYGINAFMLVVRTEDKNYMKTFFVERNVEIDTHFSSCISWALDFGYVPGSCPTAETLAEKFVMIPTYKEICL